MKVPPAVIASAVPSGIGAPPTVACPRIYDAIKSSRAHFPKTRGKVENHSIRGIPPPPPRRDIVNTRTREIGASVPLRRNRRIDLDDIMGILVPDFSLIRDHHLPVLDAVVVAHEINGLHGNSRSCRVRVVDCDEIKRTR